MKILAVIPARGGSKGIPRKNVRLLAGKPLIAHTIEQAQQAHSVDWVVVSTDDLEIASISKQYGAEVVWRPAEISGDRSASELASQEVLSLPVFPELTKAEQDYVARTIREFFSAPNP